MRIFWRHNNDEFRKQFHPDVELVVGGEAITIEQFLSLDMERLFE